MTASAESPEKKIKRLEQTVKDLEDINYLKDEMLKDGEDQGN